MTLHQRTCEKELQATKDLLSSHKGHDFDMAYLGQQIVAHTCMVAQLEAIQEVGPQNMRQFAQEASATAKDHLEHAKKLAEQLADKDENRSNSRSNKEKKDRS